MAEGRWLQWAPIVLTTLRLLAELAPGTVSALVPMIDQRPMGLITRNRAGEMTFIYHPNYPRDGVPLSPNMPVGDRPYKHAQVEAYLAGLLPDNDAVRARWASKFGVPDEPFDLLAYMGLECAGAVQFVPAPVPEGVDRTLVEAYTPMSRTEIGERLRELRTSDEEDTWTQPNEHWSLAGAQSKFTLAHLDGGWREATGAAPTTHIFKPGVRGLAHQEIAEFATMRAAMDLGLRVAPVRLEYFDGESAIVIRRFDRIRREDRIRRLHQVDLCQASGLRPTLKYEDRGGPSARRLASMIRSVSTKPDQDVRDFSDALMFNYLSLSPDGHAKNFALLLAGTQVRLAPLYDLATGAQYGKKDSAPKAAFAIGGVRVFGEAYAKHWRLHAEEFGLDPDERTERALWLAESIPDAMHDALHNDVPTALSEAGDEVNPAHLADSAGRHVGEVLWHRMTTKAPNGAGRLTMLCQRTATRIGGA